MGKEILLKFLGTIKPKSVNRIANTGADPGGAPGARPPKIGKNMIF
jgi:hypothetical protein